MVEALAVVGVVSAIVQFVDFGTRVANRLIDFSTGINNVPKAFHEIKTQLPLIIDTLRHTKDQADAQQLSEVTASALNPVIDECTLQVKELENILTKVLPTEQDSGWKKKLKAVSSLGQDKAVAQIQVSLDKQIHVLNFYLTVNNASRCSILSQYPAALRDIFYQEAKKEPCFMVRHEQDPKFVGREDEIKEIDAQFEQEQQHRVILSGIRGVGKPQIAIEYCYRYRSKHPQAHVFWVHGSSRARFEESYQQIATNLALPGLNDPNQQTLDFVQDWLNSNADVGWLMVLDNLDDLDITFGPTKKSFAKAVHQSVVQHLPQSSAGMILVTTRDRRLGERFTPGKKSIAIEPLGAKDAMNLLNGRLTESHSKDRILIPQLLHELDYLPLAISQAAGFMTENDLSMADYLEVLQSGDSEMKDFLGTEIYEPARDADLSNSVLHTWKVSFNQIKFRQPLAADILSLMACLDRQSIPEKLLHQKGHSRIAFLAAIGTLKAFSLIISETTDKVFGMHRLVQLATQRWLEMDNTIQVWQERALSSVLDSLPKHVYHDTWREWEALNPQVMKVLAQKNAKETRSTAYWLARASVLEQHGDYDVSRGLYEIGRQQLLECLSYRDQFLEPSSVAVLDIMLRVTRRRHGAIGSPENAENRVREVLQRSRHVENDVARSRIVQDALFILGQIMVEQQKWIEAEQMYRRMCTVRGKACCNFYYGSRLVEVLSKQGPAKLAEAEKLHQAMMSKLEEKDFMEIWIILGLSRNVSYLRRTGRYNEASVLCSRVVEGFKSIFTQSHTDYQAVLAQYREVLGEVKGVAFTEEGLRILPAAIQTMLRAHGLCMKDDYPHATVARSAYHADQLRTDC
ncbi:hypothetical protein P7C71_g5408, partial [Lecanoromycetidae sp. Uapishka_2]